MKVKKLVSFILVAAMMLSVFVLPATAVNENEVVVHYYNENNWENPYIYYYNDGNTPVNWPGVAMNSDGDNWYSYTINNMGTAKVIFSNNGADQYPAQNQEGLTVSGEKWYKSGSFYSQNPDLSKITVHYYNTTAWSNPYIYYYTDSANPITWPGVAMTSDGNGWYSYNIYGYDSAKVIFSDNGSNQNPGQNEPGYSVSGEKWYVNGSFYDSEPNGITVHFYNYDNWNNVNLYYYSGNLEGTNWTGNPMFADGDGWYSYKIYGLDEARVLFNNGSGIQIPGVMEEGFLVSDEMWYRNGTWTDERPDEITVYFCKPDNWSTANIYYYLNDNDTGPAWPGTAMTEVFDGWYVYHITRYASAKIMFNDGNNQIPAQNQPGLDASGVMWYKNGVWCDSETDTDEDELPDYMELLLGTNINGTDTDSDGLPDGYEVLTLGTDPLKADSDDDGINDANEDADGDGLTNLREYQLGTEPLDEDTDQDGLTDGDEVNTYFTAPKDEDTDGDTLSDSDDVALGFSPLLPDTDANGVLDCDEKIFQTLSEEISESEKPEVTDVTVSFSGTGNIHTNTTIKSIYNADIMSSNVVGLVGAPVEIETSSDFDTATITFTYDPSELDDTDEDDLSVMWYDEENDIYLLQDSTVDTINHKVFATVTHFSKYMLVDKLKWFQAWSQPIDYMNGRSVYFDTVIAIDCSGSMSWNDPFFDYTYTDSLTGNSQTINTCYRILAGKNYINAKKDDDKIAIVTFESSSTVQCNLTNSKSTAITALNSVYSSGGTNFESAISNSINILNGANDNNNKTILLLSDGESSISESTLDNAVSSHIRINTVYIGSDDDSELMQEIADTTGGEYFKATTAEELMKVYDFIARTQGIDTDDIDIDGLYDVYERNGMRLSNGEVVYTDSTDSDADNDGLLDGEEIKQEVKTVPSVLYSPFNLNNQYPEFETQIVFTRYSDPHKIDSDDDGDLDGIDPEPLNYQLNGYFIEQLKKLERMAYDYNNGTWDILMKYSVDKEYWLVFMFIRQFADGSNDTSNYISENWPIVGGEIDWTFVDYVRDNNPSVYNYFSSLEYIYANGDGDVVDIRHLAATATVYIYETDLLDAKYLHYKNYDQWYKFLTNAKIALSNMMTVAKTEMFEHHLNNLGGWAGDLQTLMIDTYNQVSGSNDYNEFYHKLYQLIGNDSFSFSMQDMYADTDAYNIYLLLAGTSNNLSNSTKSYYTYGFRNRYSTFTNNWNRETILNLVKTYTNTTYLLDIDNLRWPLFNKNNPIDDTDYYDFSENQSNASAEAFTDFLMNQIRWE